MSPSDLDKRLARAIGDLTKAAKTLAPDQQRIARRNARQRTRRVLRRIHALVDELFPAMRLPPKPRRSIDHGTRELRLRAAGYVQADYHTAVKIAAAGIRVIREAHTGRCFVPEWADMIAQKIPGRLRAAKRDIVLRKATVTAILLQQQPATPGGF